MPTSKLPYAYAYTSCPPITLEVTSEDAVLYGKTVTLLGRYRPPGGSEVVLVRQADTPQLVELLASHTNLDSYGDLPEVEERKLVADRLFEALKVIEALGVVPEGEHTSPEGKGR